MTRVTRKLEFKADLIRIWRYLAQFNEQAATALLERVDRKINRLEIFPQMGSLRDDLRPNIRLLVEGRYNIFYIFDEARALVDIIAIVEADRDPDEETEE